MLSSGKIDKYEYLRGEGILPSDQKYSFSLERASEKQTKTIEEHWRTQIDAIKNQYKRWS